MNIVKTLLKSSISLTVISAPVLAQPILDPLPLEQTRDKVTLRITQAGFFSADEAGQGIHAIQAWASGPQSGRKSFVVRYGIQSAAGAAKVTDAPAGSTEYYNAHTQRNAVTTARLFSPSGQLLQPSGGAGEPGGQQQLQHL